MRARVTVFRTQRMVIRTAGPTDAELLLRLWTHPKVMVNVGFPKGLPITRDEVEKRMAAEQEASVFERRLVVVRGEDGEVMGECAMHCPDEEGIARTDIKLLPELWGHKYGQEVKRGLLTYLFAHTDCRAVEATPNVENIASIKMQESVGGRRVGEGVFEFPAEMADYTCPVRHYVYLVYRQDWRNLTGHPGAGRGKAEKGAPPNMAQGAPFGGYCRRQAVAMRRQLKLALLSKLPAWKKRAASSKKA